jgi:hypothetical protein
MLSVHEAHGAKNDNAANGGSPTGPLAGRINSVSPLPALRLRFRCSFTRVNSAPVLGAPWHRAGLRADVLSNLVEDCSQ